MKVAFVVPRLEMGGMEMFVFRLGRALVLRGHLVDVVSAGIAGNGWHRSGTYGLGMHCFREAKSFCPISHAVQVCRFLRSQRYDVVLLNHCIQVAPALSLLPKTMKVIPVVHNDQDWVYRVACANWRAWNVAVGVSRQVTEEMRTRLPQRETKTILNGVELPDAQGRPARSFEADEFKMLFVGRLAHEQKGVMFLPEILANVRAQGINATLTVIGDGPEQQELHRTLKQLCPADSFSVLPPQTNDGVYCSMLKHHALLMPSFYEGLGMVALEAQACGCVPIASLLIGVTDTFIEDTKTGFLCTAADVTSFVMAAVRMASDRELWYRMSVAAQRRIAEEFTTEIMASKYVELFALAQQGGFERETRRNWLPLDFSIYGWRGLVPNGMRRFRAALVSFGRRSVQLSREPMQLTDLEQ